MRIEHAELRIISLPLKYPFETSFGVQTEKKCAVLRLDCEGATGWGECVAGEGPWYSEETTGTAWHILSEFALPLVVGQTFDSPDDLLRVLRPIRGNNMAKATIEFAYWDALARARNVPLSKLLGGTRTHVDCGVSIGIQESPDALVRTVERELLSGYKRIKLKIKPGADKEYVRRVRQEFPETLLMADANSAYTLEDASRLAKLDEYDLMMIEQPLRHDDIVDHAALAPQLRTPICLDESIHSAADARHALDLGACRIINIKTGRVGGLTEAVRVHDLCRERDVPVWCGGMLETNLGRAQNVALSSLPGFTLPGDVAASDRYYEKDIAFPNFDVGGRGEIEVRDTPGSGVEVDSSRLAEVTLRVEEFRP